MLSDVHVELFFVAVPGIDDLYFCDRYLLVPSIGHRANVRKCFHCCCTSLKRSLLKKRQIRSPEQSVRVDELVKRRGRESNPKRGRAMNPRMLKSAGSLEKNAKGHIDQLVAYRAAVASTIRIRVVLALLVGSRPSVSDREPGSPNKRASLVHGCESVREPHRVLCLVRHRTVFGRQSRANQILSSIRPTVGYSSLVRNRPGRIMP